MRSAWPGGTAAAERVPGGGAPGFERQVGRLAGHRGPGERIAVHRRIRCRGIVAPRHGRGGQDAPAGSADGNLLHLGHGREPVAQPVERLVHRHPVDARRQGETVVAQSAHNRPRSARMKSATRGMSSSPDHRLVRRRRIVRGDRAHRRIIGGDQRLAGLGPPGLDLGVGVALVTLDDHQIDRGQMTEQRLKRLFRCAAQLRHQRPAGRGGQDHLLRPGGTMAVAVLAGLIDIDPVMGVLDRRDAEAAPADLGHQPLDQSGLSGVLPADDPVDVHVISPHRCARAP